jgi:hypothetical protein
MKNPSDMGHINILTGFISLFTPVLSTLPIGRLGTEEKRGTTFRSNTDEIPETLTWNNETR